MSVVLEDQFKDAMAGLAAPVTVVTTSTDDGHHATTVSSFNSLSLKPPMVMLALDAASDLLAKIRESGRIGVNILAEGQDEIARRCSQRGIDKLAEVRWELWSGVPRLLGSSGWLCCEVMNEFPGGDHVILAARVLEVDVKAGAPCVYYNRQYRRLQHES